MTGARDSLDGEIAAIEALSRDQLALRWRKVYGQRPPAIRRELLSHAIAWDLQSKRLGGFSPETKRRLRQAIAQVASGVGTRRVPGREIRGEGLSPGDNTLSVKAGSMPASMPSVGARLVRVWNGHTNVVDVVEGGYLFEGKVHRSLSAIARKITKAHWSGPRFFGL
nr:DUF2924 domain-containing protein [Mesorhizobium sp.]